MSEEILNFMFMEQFGFYESVICDTVAKEDAEGLTRFTANFVGLCFDEKPILDDGKWKLD